MSAPAEFVQLQQVHSSKDDEEDEILYDQHRCEPTETTSTTRLPTNSTDFANELGRRIGSKMPYSQAHVLQFLADTLRVAEMEGFELKLDEPCPYSQMEVVLGEVETILIRILNYLYLYHPSEEVANQVKDEKNILMILHGLTVQICGVCGYDWSQPIIEGGTRSILHACVGLNFDWFLHSRTSIIEAMAKLMDGLLTRLKQHRLANSNNIPLSSVIDFRRDQQPTPLLVAFWSKVGREIMPIIRVLRQYGAIFEKAKSGDRNLFWYTSWDTQRIDMHILHLELLLTWILSEPDLSQIIHSLKGLLFDAPTSSSSWLELGLSKHIASPTLEANPRSEISRIYRDLLNHLCKLGELNETLDRTLNNIAFRGPYLEMQQAAVVSQMATIRSWCSTQLSELEVNVKTRCPTEVIYQRLTSNGYHQRGEFDPNCLPPLIHAAVSDVLAWWPQKPANFLLTIPLRLEYSDLANLGQFSNRPNLLQVLLALPPNELRRFEMVEDTLLPRLLHGVEPKYFGLTNLSARVGLSSIRLIIRGSHRPQHQYDFVWRLYGVILRKMTEFYKDRLPAQETELCFQAFVKELEQAAASQSIPDQRACVNGIMLLIDLFRSHGIDAIDSRPNRPGSDDDFYSLICVNPAIMTMWLQLHRPTSSTSVNQSNDLDTLATTLNSLSPGASASSKSTTSTTAAKSTGSPHLVYDFSPLHSIWPKRFGSRRLAEESILDTILRLRLSSTTSGPVTDAKDCESLGHQLLVLKKVREEFDQFYAPIFRSALNQHLIPDLASLVIEYLSG